MKKKVLAVVLCVALLMIAATGATLAYFTDVEQAGNTFNVGKVDGTLTEPNWNPEEDHPLLPGTTYSKDPTIALERDSEDAWLVLDMELVPGDKLMTLMALEAKADGTLGAGEDFLTKLTADKTFREEVVGRWFQGINHAEWKVMNASEIALGNSVKIRLGHYAAMQQGTPTASIKFMDSFTIPKTVTSEMMKTAGFVSDEDVVLVSTVNVNFVANFIQMEGLADIDAAYAALNA